MVDAVRAEFLVQVEDDLRIAARTEAVAAGLQPRSMIGVVVDLAVEDQPDGAVLV